MGAPNLKRVIDLVRILAAADLRRTRATTCRDVARTLGFASASHLSATCQRIIGMRSSSLARLAAGGPDRPVREAGRGRSRVA
jgi:AraC-like DNA-binding protein